MIVKNIEEIQAAMQAIVDAADAENRSLTDEEVAKYEGLETDLKAVAKTAEIRNRQSAYSMPNVLLNPITGNAKGDEVIERAFDHYLRTGTPNADLTELRAQATGTDSAGGYTTPPGFRTKLVEVQKRFGGIRSVAEVITTADGNTLEYPTNDDTANEGAIVAESAVVANGADLVFGTVALGAFKYTSAGAGSNLPVRVPVELLQDSAFDVASLVSRKLGTRIARKQASDFAVGVGSTSGPNGLFTTTSNMNDAGTTLTYAKFVDAYHTIDPYYRDNAVWIMNDSTLAEVEKLVDTAGRPLIQTQAAAGINGAPSGGTLLGKPIVLDNATVTTSGNNYVAFGDIREGYIIRDVKDVTVVVNPYSRATYGEVEYHAWARADADIQNRSAFVTIKSHRVA
jgi:HK97 family phage major capsid protein